MLHSDQKRLKQALDNWTMDIVVDTIRKLKKLKNVVPENQDPSRQQIEKCTQVEIDAGENYLLPLYSSIWSVQIG